MGDSRIVVDASAFVDLLNQTIGRPKRVAAAGGVGRVPIAIAVAAAEGVNAGGRAAVLVAESFVGDSMGRHD